MFSSISEIIVSIFMFCLILFFYLHIQFHLKTSNELEIYEIDQASKDRIEEICDLRQPVLLDFPDLEDGFKIINTTNKKFLLDNYPVFEVKIRNKKIPKKFRDLKILNNHLNKHCKRVFHERFKRL